MKHILRPSTLIAAGIAAVLIAAGAVWAARHNVPQSADAHSAASAAAQNQPHTAGQSAGADTSKAAAQNVSAKNSGSLPAANTPACSLLTPGIAAKALGAAAKSGPADTGLMPPAAGTSLSFCAYAAGTKAVQLSVRTPKNSLGASENATEFGSDRPHNATAVTGYGQAAYWAPDKHQFNILAGNAWYMVTLKLGSQPANAAATEAAAKLLAPKL